MTFTGLFGHLHLCFFPLLFFLSPLFSRGRLRNDQSVFDAAGPCFGFPMHMSPGNYKKAPSRQLLLCNTRVWSRKKRRRMKRSKTKRKIRRKRWKIMSNNVWFDIYVTAVQRIYFTEKTHEFLNIHMRSFSLAVTGPQLLATISLNHSS